MKVIAVIPARYKSSRFEGKPLADIKGKPMIWWVYQQAAKVKEINEVIVATEDERIKDVCEKLNIKVMLTSDEHQTGTDRVAEVARKVQADLYVNIQGDEPMIEPETIREAILPFMRDKNLSVSNLMTKINDPVDLNNFTVPKVIVNHKNIGIFLTRSSAPYPKGSIDFNYYKQVCVYGFTPESLQFFASSKRGRIESIEDIEILRFIENQILVKFVEVDTKSVAVDTPKDLEKVRRLI
jgi:3-deoxy-manno-octulosonate cytidylyltransferase (CMP-KDO synthetase)